MYKGKSVNAIIQARMGSTRLPGKVLKDLGGKKVLDHVVDRLSRSELIDKIIVATSIEKQDDAIKEWGNSREVTIFRGSEDNVLKRYYDCSQKYPSDIICRITADCPLISYRLVDEIIRLIVNEKRDYVTIDDELIPRGLHGSVFPKDVLDEVYHKASKDYHFEHVTYYIYEDNNDNFNIGYLEPSEWLKRNYRLTLDTELDYELLKKLFDTLFFKEKYLDLKEIIYFLDDNPSVSNINREVEQKKVKK